mgnify:CR=1 FL=1
MLLPSSVNFINLTEKLALNDGYLCEVFKMKSLRNIYILLNY